MVVVGCSELIHGAGAWDASVHGTKHGGAQKLLQLNSWVFTDV